MDHAAWLARCSMTHPHDDELPPKPPPDDPPALHFVDVEPADKHARLCGSPVEPSSSASSGFSDDDSLHCDIGHTALTIDQFVDHVRSKGRQGLLDEYAEIRERKAEGSFNVAKYGLDFFFF